MAKDPTMTVCRLSDELVLLAFEGYTQKQAHEISQNILQGVQAAGSKLKVVLFISGRAEMLKSADFEAGVRAIYRKIQSENI